MRQEEPFVFLPEHTLLAEEYKGLKRGSKILFIYLVLRRRGQDEEFTYSYKEIRADTGQTYNTISQGIKELEKEGMLKYKHGGLEVNHNIYYIPPDWLTRW